MTPISSCANLTEMARQGKESDVLPEVPPEDQTQTLYVKAIRKTAVKEIKKAAIDGGCGIGEIIERMLAAYARSKKPAT